jgi:GPI inositol-deacylase
VIWRSKPLTALSMDRSASENPTPDSLLPPLLHHTLPPRTGSSESHFYVETTTRPIFITSHSSGPFVSSRGAIRGSILEIYTSGTCGIKELKLGIDWRASLGRAASRYWSSLGVWAVGVVGLIMASGWTSWDFHQAGGSAGVLHREVF